MSLKHTAAHAAFITAVSLAALLFSDAVAVADPTTPVPAPPELGVVDNAAADDRPPEEQPAENTDCPWCELVQAAQQLPPPDFSGVGVPPLADVSVPVSLGIGLPDLVPDIGIPITLPPPPQLPEFQAPPLPQFQPPPPPQLPPPPNFGPPQWPF